jgi:hypothetical protein
LLAVFLRDKYGEQTRRLHKIRGANPYRARVVISPMSLDSPSTAAAGAILVGVIAVIVRLRRLAVPRATLWFCLVGAAAWALAAGDPSWRRPHEGQVNVLLDLSPSTRIADFRDRQRLDARIAELLGHVKYHLEFFADGAVNDAGNGAALADVPCEKTTLPPLTGDAVVLFSDARFPLPAAGPPTYIVADPALEDPNDAAISEFDIRNGQVSATVRNTGKPRGLTVAGASSVASPGEFVVTQPLPAGATVVTAQLSVGDPWPENDVLSASPLPPPSVERWWIGSQPPDGWRSITPDSLPTDESSYLSAGVIVLQNVPAASLDATRRQLLKKYVDEIGGGLIIVGGDRAFGAGRYLGTELEAISPLSSVPPRPTMRWVLLADGSGSMAGPNWQNATDALANVLPRLPPNDLADVGSFAQALSWWSTGKTIAQTAKLSLPPADVSPHGPTNLEPVLLQIARSSNGAMPTHLLLISDADVQIDQPAALIALLRQKNIHLHLLAIGAGSGLPVLRHIAATTGGSVVQQLDPRQWTSGAADLLTAAMPTLLQREPISIHFENDLAALPVRPISQWNRTWLKALARELAFADVDGQHVPLAAQWLVGQGSVCAAAFPVNSQQLDRLVKLTAREPHDPRFAVTWQTGPSLHVRIDALDGEHYLNEQGLTLQLGQEPPTPVPQIGPGRYELNLPAPRTPTFAALRAAGHVLDRIAVAGRYAPEFDTLGNDHAAMEELAQRTGGTVIAPGNHHPISFNWPRRDVPLTPWLAAVGALLSACGFAVWRLQ